MAAKAEAKRRWRERYRSAADEAACVAAKEEVAFAAAAAAAAAAEADVNGNEGDRGGVARDEPSVAAADESVLTLLKRKVLEAQRGEMPDSPTPGEQRLL